MRGLFKAATPDGPKEVDAAVLTKHLAVHRSLGGGGYWSVSHRPTGCRMGCFDKKAQAVAAAEALERENAADLETLAGKRFAVGARPKFHGKQVAASKRLRNAINALGRVEALV